MSIPLPPGTTAIATSEDTSLDQSSVSFILDTTLSVDHRDDPNVLRYIQSYLACRDNKQACDEVGIHWKSGQALRRRPDIHNAISKITDASLMRHGFDASEVVEKVKEIAFVDIGEIEDEDGTYKTSLRALSPEFRRAIKKFKVKNTFSTDPNGVRVISGEIIEVEMWDKMKAVDLLGREKSLFKETKRIEHDIANNMKDVLLESTRLADAQAQEMRDVEESKVIDVSKKE